MNLRSGAWMSGTCRLVVLVVTASAYACAQSVTGYSIVNIDPISNTVVATCETDLDAPTEALYAPKVDCTLKDGTGKVLASGSESDEDSGNGYASSTLTARAVPGSTYTVDSDHFEVVMLVYKDNLVALPAGTSPSFADPFDFASIPATPEAYIGGHVWYAVNAEGESLQRRAEQPDQIDARAFAVLFRLVNTYERMSKAVQAPGASETKLSLGLVNQLQLRGVEAEGLRRIALQWEQGRSPLQDQVRRIVMQYRASFPGGSVAQGTELALPANLQTLQQQMDALTLQWRDSFRNTMPEPDYQRVHALIWTMLANEATKP